MTNRNHQLQDLQLKACREHLRQARQTFDLFRLAIALALGISLVGGVLLFTGKTTEGTVNTASGLIAATFCAQISKDASEKLDRLTKNLKALCSSVEQ
jgi:predicted lysophospholipase L1 biosynthesis ABC-type transport system permease subunit